MKSDERRTNSLVMAASAIWITMAVLAIGYLSKMGEPVGVAMIALIANLGSLFWGTLADTS